ncbi:MAG: DUF4383 domain-containing protein [Methylococcales bacterium]|nr:DUF4383 domain-containing protein [Methylococcales bacterium]
MFNAKLVAVIFGLTFVAVGLMGFVENSIASEYGFFQANWAHNLVHLITGAIFLLGAVNFLGQEKRFVLYSGYFYGLVALLGFFWPGDMLLGFIHINEPDRWLHLGLAIVIVAAGVLSTPVQAWLRAEYS